MDLSWTLANITAVTQVITGTGIVGSVSVPPGTYACVVNGPFASEGSWTININSGALTSTASLAFLSRRYWGVSSTSPLTNAEVMLRFFCLRERGDQELLSPALAGEFCRQWKVPGPLRRSRCLGVR